MVKANRTTEIRSTSITPADAPSQDESIAKFATRREEGPNKPPGERRGGAPVRETAKPRCRNGHAEATVAAYIGRELREIYDDVLAQPVPDRFLSLLNKLDAGAISAAQTADRPGEMD